MARWLGGLAVVLLVLTSAAGRAEAAWARPRVPHVATETKALLTAVWDRIVTIFVGPIPSGTVAPRPDGTDAGWEMDPNGSLTATITQRP